MKRLVKSYHVFLPYAWEKWLLYLAYPAVLILTACKLGQLGVITDRCIVLCSSMIVLIEPFFDLLVFGGIAAKDTNKLEYLKTSVKGMSTLRKSLIVDGVRRTFTIAIIILLTGYLLDTTGFEGMKFVLSIVCTLYLTEMSLMLVRGLSHMGVILATVSFIAGAAVPFGMFLLEADVIVGVICLILYILSWVMGRVLIMRRARRSYYDSRD